MAFDLLQIALDFLEQYGLVAVFVLLVLDGAMLMPVLPGEVVMIMAVATYADTPGDLVLLIALATAAAIVGSVFLYAIMRIGGRRLVENHPRLFMMSKRRRQRLERSFQKPLGQTLVLFLRIIPLTRVLVNIPAGLAKMKFVRFVVLSSIGMLIFHAGFMWFAYEYRQPGSPVAEQAAVLQAAYASPAWEYLQTNQVVAGLGLLALGAFLSLRASRRIMKDPDAGGQSLIGWLAARVLFLGAIPLAALTWYDVTVLYEWALAGGLNVAELAGRVNLEPEVLLLSVAAAAWSLGGILLGLEGAAKRSRKHYERIQREEREARQERERRVKEAATRQRERGGGQAEDSGS